MELTNLVEGYLLSYYDREICYVTHIIYRNMRDESFFWIMEKFLANQSNDELFRIYDLLIQNMGYYSGGFSLEYLLSVKELIGNTQISIEHKLSIVNGVIRVACFLFIEITQYSIS
jgi:hypothetical protein